MPSKLFSRILFKDKENIPSLLLMVYMKSLPLVPPISNTSFSLLTVNFFFNCKIKNTLSLIKKEKGLKLFIAFYLMLALCMYYSSDISYGLRTEIKKMMVDNVAFAIYKREVIERGGLMDETLPVNQDDEFHYRIRSKGYRIMMIPEMSATYYVRDSFIKLFRQYFRYGLYKPPVLRKIKGSIRLRHLVPSIFTLYLISLPIYIYIHSWILPLLIYFCLLIFRSVSFRESWEIRMLTLPVYPLLHISYGAGFLAGLFKKYK